MRRGDIVIVDFRPTDPTVKVRPCLVVQNDRDNAVLHRTIVTQITSDTSRGAELTYYLIDERLPEWCRSGLHHPSAVNCSNLATVSQLQVTRIIGSLSSETMQQVNRCLQAALGLP